MPPRSTLAARSKSRPSKMGKVIGVVISLVFTGIGIVALYGLAIRPVWGILQARDWVQTQCTVVSSELKVHPGDSDTYSIAIVFKYTFDGREYQSDRYDFISMSSNTSIGRKRAIVRDHPPGKQTVCYVDPSRPDRAVIDRGWSPDMWWGLFPIPFLAIGVGMGLGMMGVFSRPAKRRRIESESTEVEPNGDDDTMSGIMPDEMPSQLGPVTLKSKSSPIVGFIVALLLSVFWNGIVSIFLWQVIAAFQRGKPEWGLTLFLTPFVLVGCGLVLLTVYSFLSLFNPRPILTVSAASVALGKNIRVAWQFTGRTGSMRHLKIELQGKEVAVYTRGTTTYTDTEKFATIRVTDTEDPFQMESGELTVTVPRDTMHSFQAAHNRIEWTLHLHGEIGLWPDVMAEFPIVVTPIERGGGA